jgi:uncharacterized protein
MDTSAKRLPRTDDPLTAPFWQGTLAAEVRVQRCADCGYLRWPPAPLCPQCLSPAGGWVPLQGHGSLLTYCVYHRALDPAFADEIPYAVGYVQLDEGPRMYGQVDGPVQALQAGQPVRAVFRPVSDDVSLVHWTATSAAGASSPERAEGTGQHDG